MGLKRHPLAFDPPVLAATHQQCIEVRGTRSLVLHNDRHRGAQEFSFDQVMGPEVTQAEMFEGALPVTGTTHAHRPTCRPNRCVGTEAIHAAVHCLARIAGASPFAEMVNKS